MTTPITEPVQAALYFARYKGCTLSEYCWACDIIEREITDGDRERVCSQLAAAARILADEVERLRAELNTNTNNNTTTTMNEQKYLDLMHEVYTEGEWRSDRTGTGVSSLFGKQVVYDLKDGFPLLTTKKIHWKSVVHELLWFLSGSTNIKYLQDNGVHIWDAWADVDGNLGPVYGSLWRNFGERLVFPGVDQIQNLIDGIRANPYSRRHIVSAWDPVRTSGMALPPCHCFFQIYVHQNGEIDLQLYQRSADIFLGVPFNIASYSLLLMMIAKVTGYKAGRFIHTMGDVHLYRNHVDAYFVQRDRTILPPPTVTLNAEIKSIFDFTFEDINLDNYNPHPAIKAPVAV